MLQVYNYLLLSPSFWLLSLLIIITSLLPDFSIQCFDAFGFKWNDIFPGAGNMIPDQLKQRFQNVSLTKTSNSNNNNNNNETREGDAIQITQL